MHTTTLTRVVGLAEWDALRVVLGLCRSLQCGHGGTLPVAESSPSLDEWCPWLIPPRVWISLLSLSISSACVTAGQGRVPLLSWSDFASYSGPRCVPCGAMAAGQRIEHGADDFASAFSVSPPPPPW